MRTTVRKGLVTITTKTVKTGAGKTLKATKTTTTEDTTWLDKVVNTTAKGKDRRRKSRTIRSLLRPFSTDTGAKSLRKGRSTDNDLTKFQEELSATASAKQKQNSGHSLAKATIGDRIDDLSEKLEACGVGENAAAGSAGPSA